MTGTNQFISFSFLELTLKKKEDDRFPSFSQQYDSKEKGNPNLQARVR